MRNLKKVLALVIAFSMMLSVVAFASYNDVAADAEYAGAVELLSALEIIKGDDLGNFNPDNTITRAEMAAIVCRAKGLENAANGAKGFTAFNDVAADHWASGYVNLASQNGIINGYGDGNFGPEDTVTYEQAVKMLVCALGFEPMAATKGGFPTGYLVVANTYGVTEGVTATVEAPRKTVAQLVYNALSTPMMDQTTFGADAEYEIFDGKKERDYKTLLTEMDIYIAEGVVGDKNGDSVIVTIKETSDCETFKKGATEDFVIADTNIASYKNQYVEIYAKEDGRDFVTIAVVASNLGETLTILSDDIVKLLDKEGKAATSFTDLAEIEYYVDSANSNKTKTVKIAVTEMEFNKGEGKFSDLSLDDVEVQLIENDGNNTYDAIVATQYQSDRVEYVEEDKLGLKLAGTVKFDFDAEENDETTIILVDDAGKELTLADFAEDDVVAYVWDTKNVDNRKYIKVVKLTNATVTGAVDESYVDEGDKKDETDDIYYVVIDGNEYVDYTKKLKTGDEGSFYIGITGKIIDYDATLAGENYAFILEGAISKNSFTADQWQLKLLTKEDGIVTYDVTKNYHPTVVKYLIDNAADFGLTTTTTGTGDEAVTTIDQDEFLYDTAYANKELDKSARLVTFKTNANGEIKELLKAEGSTTPVADEYKADAQSIAKKALEDDVVIFNVSGSDVDDAYTTNIDYLVDESEYKGFVLKDADDAYSALVITELQSAFTPDTGIAIVTKISSSKDANDENITKVTYVMDETEGSIIFDGEEKIRNANKELKLGLGTAFVFAADGAGVVSEYAIIAQVESGVLKLVDDYKAIAGLIDDETVFVSGYIWNESRNANSRGEVITYTASDDTITVRGTSNKYTFNTKGRNATVEVSDFMSDVEYYDEEEGIVYQIIARLDSGVVVDVYTITTEIKKADANVEITEDDYAPAE